MFVFPVKLRQLKEAVRSYHWASRAPQGGVQVCGMQYIFHMDMQYVKSICFSYALIPSHQICSYAYIFSQYAFMQKQIQYLYM